ncbi:MAG: SBBP repeat-containing protein [Ignavibacteria bacterium]|nr:SBBP repeat-containing protein [Ignavibacteria bacterium]
MKKKKHYLVLFWIILTLLTFHNSFSQVNQVWVAIYNGFSGALADYSASIAVDGLGNIYVTGSSNSNGINSDYATIKYNSSGDSVWVKRYNGPGNSNDRPASIAVDGSGNVYVTGYSDGIGTNSDYATIKYNSSGELVWVKRHNGSGNSIDEATSIAVDFSGSVYVTGS